MAHGFKLGERGEISLRRINVPAGYVPYMRVQDGRGNYVGSIEGVRSLRRFANAILRELAKHEHRCGAAKKRKKRAAATRGKP